MKLLFIHTFKMKVDKNGNLYTGGSYNQEAWDRYLFISDELTVCARKEKFIYEVNDAESKFNYFDTNKIKFVETPNNNSSIGRYINIFNNVKLNKLIKDQVYKSDCVIARLPSSNGNIAIKFAKRFNKPYLVEVVGCAFDSLWNHSWKGKILAFLKYKAMKKSVIDAPHAVYVTKQFLQERYPTKGKSINCSNVALEQFDEKVIHYRLNRINNMKDNDKKIIGTAAAVDVRYKGQQYIIKALGRLKKQGITNFEYQIVGGGDQTYLKSIALKNGVINQVKFLGAMPHVDIFSWLDNIDLYAQPSLTEGLPRSLIEAMSRGLPSIGSNAGGIPELIDNELVFKAKSTNDICNLLKNLDKKLMRREAKQNFNKAKQYDKKILEERRQSFLINFKKVITK